MLDVLSWRLPADGDQCRTAAEFGHRDLRQVAPGDGPFVVLIGEHGPHQSDHRPVVREDADDVVAPLDLLVQAFERVVRTSRGHR